LKFFSWRPLVIAAVLIVACIYLLPTINPGWWPNKNINLGLDLQGGMHLVLEVQTEKAIENKVDSIANDLMGRFRSEQIAHRGISRVNGSHLSIRIKGTESIDKFKELIKSDYKELVEVKSSTANEITQYVYELPEDTSKYIKKLATEQALETIRNRIDEFGVSEPDIRIQGENRILIQLPGISDPQRAKDLIGRTALLEFKLVDETHDVQSALSGTVPAGSELLYVVRTDTETQKEIKTPMLVKKQAVLTGSYLTDARVEIDSQQFNEPYVSLTFDKKGGKLFSRITGDNKGKRLAIVLDNKVHSAPVIQDKISGGQARITGSFTTDEAHDLAIVLRAGALPAPVIILEERTVGPSLGADSIQKGLFSMYIGGILVIIFMIIYYKGSGLVADLALVVNILLIAAGLAAFQATLTLPGIAGIILTIGMAVDANVIIFERIREELRIGKTPRSAVDTGYNRATLTILDANVTTLIAALVLFQFGTGPVKGFAVTLCLGVIASMITALIMTRLIFDFFLINRKIKRLSI